MKSRKLVSKQFTQYEQVHYDRSHQDLSHGHSLTMNTGDLVPFEIIEVSPGDTISIKTTNFNRLQTLISPIFDNLYCDMYYFFVPHRLSWEHWQEFMGENNTTYWTEPTTYQIPQVTSPEAGWSVGTIADYLGIPTGVGNISVSALPFRAYAKIVNDWFRDENLQNPCDCPIDDIDVEGSNGDDYVLDCVKGGLPFIAAKYHDMFTSALPQPQKGDPVTIGIGNDAPIVFGDKSLNSNYTPVDNFIGTEVYGMTSSTTGSPIMLLNSQSSTTQTGDLSNNIVADLSQASAININDLRMAIAVQKLLEKDARGGTRYIEILKSHFGVDSADARLQRSEYLGGKRFQVKINPIYQTSQTSDVSPLGDVGAVSSTIKEFDGFNKSFTEHGYIIGLLCFRYPHVYSQGLNKLFSRKDRFDFYDPIFDHIGEQPILNKEIKITGTETDNEVFGYQEAWVDYRHMPNRVSGYMRPYVDNALKQWTIADDYDDVPKLSSDWIREDKNNVDRTLYVSSELTHQFLVDIFQDIQAYRVMSNHSIPKITA